MQILTIKDMQNAENSDCPDELKEYLLSWKTTKKKTNTQGQIIQQQYSNPLFCARHILINALGPINFEYFHETCGVKIICWLIGSAKIIFPGDETSTIKENTAVIRNVERGKGVVSINKGIFRFFEITFEKQLAGELQKAVSTIDLKVISGIPITADIRNKIIRIADLSNIGDDLNILLTAEILKLTSIINHEYKKRKVSEEEEYKIPNYEAVRSIHKIIKNNPNVEECKVHKLASQYHLRPQTLSACFTKTYKINLKSYILGQVMNKAMLLLKQTRMSIKDISEELGYSTSSNFTRAFLDYHKIYPSKIRQQKVDLFNVAEINQQECPMDSKKSCP